eukprot:3505528-Prymnesium_polylepis.1
MNSRTCQMATPTPPPPPPPPPDAPPPGLLSRGARVRIENLLSRVDLNGTEASAIELLPNGRWSVLCTGGEKVKIKPDNLIVLAAPSNTQARE